MKTNYGTRIVYFLRFLGPFIIINTNVYICFYFVMKDHVICVFLMESYGSAWSFFLFF